MERLYEAKEYIQRFYAKYSKQIDMAWHFGMALLTFWLINNRFGFLPPLGNMAVTVGLAVICAFLTVPMTLVMAVILLLIQLGTLALGIALASGLIMLIMFGFYFRFSPKHSVILLLTPIAFALHVPVLIPIMVGLLGSSVCVVPVIFGVVIYYMLSYVETYAMLLGNAAEAGLMGQMTTFVQQLFANKEMWMVIISFIICLLLVYSIRRLSVDFAWMIAAVAGVLANLIMMTFGHVIMDVQVAYGELILTSVLAIVVAFILYTFTFSVNYSQCEYLQFEDDDNYYYVKAIPKVTISVREKTVKKINVRQETGMMDVEEIQKAVDESNSKEIQDKILDFEESEIQRLIEEELNK